MMLRDAPSGRMEVRPTWRIGRIRTPADRPRITKHIRFSTPARGADLTDLIDSSVPAKSTGTDAAAPGGAAAPATGERVRVIREGVASYLPDIDPEGTGEWLESFDTMLEREGPQRARYLMLRLLERAGERHVSIPALTSTDYVNTIPTENEPWFPGDEEVERRYRAFIRWNAAIMVHRAQRPGI